jgi:hypothetical protein
MYIIELVLVFAFAIAVIGISTYALVDWWRRKQASEPYPVREVPHMLSMMEMEDGSFVLKLREGPTTHIDDSFDGVKFIFTGGYLKEIRARNLDALGTYLRASGGFYEASVLLNEIEAPRRMASARTPRGVSRRNHNSTLRTLL